METLLAELAERLAHLHTTIHRAIDGLPDEALDWTPGADMNPLAVLLAHTLGAERYWIGDVAGLEPSGRDREAEFLTQGVGTTSFLARADGVLAHSQAVLARLSADDLGQVRIAPLFGQEVTVAWALLHALEHTALHAGHIEIIRQLWDQRAR